VASLINKIVSHIVRTKIKRAIIFYPNSGEEWDPKSSNWVEGSGCTAAYEFATCIVRDGLSTIYDYLDENADGIKIPVVVGGCCRTDPSTIREISKQVDTFQEHRTALGMKVLLRE